MIPDPIFGELISSYSRAEAIADGVLVDVSRQASPAEMLGGFTVPVAVTAALWAAIEAIPPRLIGIADTRGRLHDVLWMARVFLMQQRHPGRYQSVIFALVLPSRGTRFQTRRVLVNLGPSDDGGPCVTIGFPDDF